jgi:hypothetical protein
LASVGPEGEYEEQAVERKWWTLIAVSVAIFMLLLDITVVNVALPDVRCIRASGTCSGSSTPTR